MEADAGAQAENVRENRLRRMAERQGYALRKWRTRDPRALTYGRYMLVEPNRNVLVSDERLSLDEVEDWPTSVTPRHRRRCVVG